MQIYLMIPHKKCFYPQCCRHGANIYRMTSSRREVIACARRGRVWGIPHTSPQPTTLHPPFPIPSETQHRSIDTDRLSHLIAEIAKIGGFVMQSTSTTEDPRMEYPALL